MFQLLLTIWLPREHLHTNYDMTQEHKLHAVVYLASYRTLLFLCRKKAKEALWFGETYGLIPESLTLRDKTGQSHEIKLTGNYTYKSSIFYKKNSLEEQGMTVLLSLSWQMILTKKTSLSVYHNLPYRMKTIQSKERVAKVGRPVYQDHPVT